MKLVFATNNENKIKEVHQLLNNNFHVLRLKDIGCYEELPETGNTLENNAKQKAQYVFSKYKIDCFADDTGLEVVALNGEPGVYSARYAGEEKSAEKNINKILRKLTGETNRKASFITVVSLILNNKEHLFEGRIDGEIAVTGKGKNGFGYDPIFIPIGSSKTFAEMTLEEKNKISHRALAIKKLAAFLNDLYANQ